jgi:hypothetical protein
MDIIEGYEATWAVVADADHGVVSLDSGSGMILLKPDEAIALGRLLARSGEIVARG